MRYCRLGQGIFLRWALVTTSQMPLMNSTLPQVTPGLTLQGPSRSEGWRNSTVVFRQLPHCTDLHLIPVSIRFPIW